MKAKIYYVYLLTNRSGTLYVGVTNDLRRRLWEHSSKNKEGFTSSYNLNRLIYFEAFEEVRLAIAREKQIKSWSRIKKINLVRKSNPSFKDLTTVI
ncbi:MAG TPA: GIY-YIG nuclease family protein [bacterium]|nr:GIY-YIG nuclease family protein [bacterium]